MEVSEQIQKFEEFIETHNKVELLERVRSGKKSLTIDFGELSKFNPEMAELVLEEPEEILRAAELAIANFDLPGDIKGFRVRIKNLSPDIRMFIRNIRSTHLGKFFMVEGTVRQKSDVRPQVTSARFECPACGNIMNVLQLDSKFKEPTKCGCGRKGKFRMLSKELVDAQGIVLEESTKDLEGGEQPKRINVLLKDELVSPISEKKTNPGSSIRIMGIVKEVPIILRSGGQSTKFDIVFEANNVEGLEEDYTNIKITDEEEKLIIELSQDRRLFEKLAHALAPGIYGHEKIKEALLMQFVGGVRKMRSDGVPSRGDIHILLIGDPGSGKSMLLKRGAVVAPKARYVSGKGVSAAGLTAAVVRDEFLSGWSLEAGAMVLANRGIVMIDELDKMSEEDTSAMHEALEQQSYHHDFEIMFADGRKEKIGEYVDRLMLANKNKIINSKDCEILELNDIRLLSTDFDKVFPISAARISRHSSPKTYYKVSFSNGRSITVTPEHPLFAYKEGAICEIPASQATRGMIVPAVRRLPALGKLQHICSTDYPKRHKKISLPKTLDPPLARLLGYILSEGHTYRNKKNRYAEIGVSNTDMAIVKDCAALFSDIFRTTISINKSFGVKSTKARYTVRCPSIPLYDFFALNFSESLTKANKKRVPIKILASPDQQRLEFLRAYFKGDGFVDSERTGYSTSSYLMACDLQDMLLMQRIWSYIATENRDGTEYHKVVVSGEDSLAIFAERIVIDDHRRARVDAFLDRSKIRRNARDLVPLEIVRYFNDFLKRCHASDGYFTTLVRRGQNSHRKVMIEYLENAKTKCRTPALKAEAAKFERMLSSDIRFITITRVEKTKDRNKWVYDVTVEPTRTFISCGIVLHNTISISKANIQATLRCETTVLAAANPKFGRFDDYQTIAKQIDMPPALINRFDLIFTIRDFPDEEKDKKMADFILTLHKKSEIEEGDIDTNFLRKYLVYCKQKIYPKLTDSALEELKEYYLKMRGSSGGEGAIKSVSISARQLEALIRLAEAAAKIRLSDKVTKKDAQKAVSLLHYCLEQVGMDSETGKIDIDRIVTGIPASERSRIANVREIIAELEQKVGKMIQITDIMQSAEERGIDKDLIDEAIEKLKRSGDLFEPKKGFISRIM